MVGQRRERRRSLQPVHRHPEWPIAHRRLPPVRPQLPWQASIELIRTRRRRRSLGSEILSGDFTYKFDDASFYGLAELQLRSERTYGHFDLPDLPFPCNLTHF